MKTFISITVLAVILVALIFSTNSKATKDYCAKELCRKGAHHIACNNNGKISSKCAKNSEVVNLNNLKDLIVDTHNSYRNKVAGGQIEGYNPAVKMATMTWDDELAYLAELNVKTCEFNHDECRNTDNFKHSGQNLGMWSGYPAIEAKEAVTKSIDDWFAEHPYANMDIIKSFRPSKDSQKVYGHFTAMIADKNIKVGCGCLKIHEDKRGPSVAKDLKITTYLFACNYATTNILDLQIYKSGGKPASECTKGRNPSYKFLCSVNEPYDPNSVE